MARPKYDPLDSSLLSIGKVPKLVTDIIQLSLRLELLQIISHVTMLAFSFCKERLMYAYLHNSHILPQYFCSQFSLCLKFLSFNEIEGII